MPSLQFLCTSSSHRLTYRRPGCLARLLCRTGGSGGIVSSSLGIGGTNGWAPVLRGFQWCYLLQIRCFWPVGCFLGTGFRGLRLEGDLSLDPARWWRCWQSNYLIKGSFCSYQTLMRRTARLPLDSLLLFLGSKFEVCGSSIEHEQTALKRSLELYRLILLFIFWVLGIGVFLSMNKVCLFLVSKHHLMKLDTL